MARARLGRAELKTHWFLVIAALLGALMVGAPLFTTGVFMAQWEHEFGWSRSEISLATSIYNGCLVLMSPVIGRLVDRFGVRRPALISMAFLAAAFCLGALITPHIWTLYAIYAAIALLGSGTTFVSFTRSISEYFVAARGLALSIATSATMVGILLLPVMVFVVIQDYGWRSAWLAMGAITAFLWPIVWLGLKDTHIASRSSGPVADGRKMAFAEVFRSRNFRILLIAFFLMSLGTTGLIIQAVPITQSYGLSGAQAIAAASVMAVGIGVSRILAGFLLDYFFAPVVLVIACALGVLGCGLLMTGSPALAFVGIFFIGTASGSEGDVVAYSTARYFGLTHYARSYGVMYGAMLTGGIVSPVLIGVMYDLQGTYFSALTGCVVALGASALLMSRMPGYPSSDGILSELTQGA